MYDLTWARQVVENTLELATRGQLMEREFEAFQTTHGVRDYLKFDYCLCWLLAASQGRLEASKLWNRVKNVIKRPPACAKLVEKDMLDLYLYGYRKGRHWKQSHLFGDQNLAD